MAPSYNTPDGLGQASETLAALRFPSNVRSPSASKCVFSQLTVKRRWHGVPYRKVSLPSFGDGVPHEQYLSVSVT